MRKLLVAIVALAFIVAVPTAVMAATGAFSSSVDLQRSKWDTTQVATSSQTWRPIANLSTLNICSLNQVTATLSVELTGAPAGFQIRADGGPLMQPGSVRFVPAGAHDSFSFTFVLSLGTFENNDHHAFEVEWRSPTGGTTTLERATLNLQYQQGTHSC